MTNVYYAVVNSTSCLKKEERRNKLRSISNLLLYDSMLSRISSCTHSLTEMESWGSISVMDDAHSSACNIGHFLGQAFSAIYFFAF